MELEDVSIDNGPESCSCGAACYAVCASGCALVCFGTGGAGLLAALGVASVGATVGALGSSQAGG